MWEFKVKSKKKKKKNGPAHEGPPIKPVKPASKPVKPAGKPVAREFLNFKPVKPTGKLVKPAGKPVKPAGKPVAWEFLNLFEFGFEFNRFPPVTGLTGPVNRYRRAAVRPVRSDFKTLVSTRTRCRRRGGSLSRSMGIRFLTSSRPVAEFRCGQEIHQR